MIHPNPHTMQSSADAVKNVISFRLKFFCLLAGASLATTVTIATHKPQKLTSLTSVLRTTK